MIPVQSQGLKMISMGLLNPGDKPMIWRGPMLHSVITQFLRSVEWGELDYLIIDLPPGTGDVQLTLIQTVAVTGAVVVTTPSTVALADVRKAIEMFRQVNVEVLGVVENMSSFACPHCGKAIDIFGHGEGAKTALAYGVPVGLIERIAPGEGYEGAFRERGFCSVDLAPETDKGIFDGLPETITVWESHCDEVKSLPADFSCTATNKVSQIQAMQHATRPLFGVQFHPELFDQEHPHGRIILENFLKL
jgi:ATP-binding protein involved in chromosome partitioning